MDIPAGLIRIAYEKILHYKISELNNSDKKKSPYGNREIEYIIRTNMKT